jgi:hypothetical protein
MAVAEFQKLLDHRGRLGNSPLSSLAHLQLARAFTSSSESARARVEYQEFLALWKGADPDTPFLRRAQSELANLK